LPEVSTKNNIKKYYVTWVELYAAEKKKLERAEKARLTLKLKQKREQARLDRLDRSDGVIQGSFKEEAKLFNKSPVKKQVIPESVF